MRPHSRRRPVRGLLLAVVATSILAGLALDVPAAGAVTFDHWPGNVAINYDYNGKPEQNNVQKGLKVLGEPVPTAVGTTIEKLWQKTSKTAVCNHIQTEVAALLKQPTPVADWSCSLPASGDVLGRLEASNVVGVDFLLEGIALTFDVNDPHGTASVDATLDVDFHVDLDFASTVNGASKSTTAALSIGSSSIRVVGGKLTAYQFGITQGALQPYADKIESLVVNNVAGWVGLPAQIKHVNQSIEELAHFLYLDPFWGVKTSYPDANQVFNLSIGVSRSNLTLTYARQPLQPAPKSCTYYPDGGPSGTGVEAICSPNQAKGVTTLLLQGHTGGKWTDNPLDSTYEPGAHPGPQWAFLGSPPYADWSPNNGPDSGYAPVLVDYPVTSHTTVEMRVCSSNFWGLNCDAGVNVSGYTAGGSSGSSGGGGGGGGGGGVTGSGTGSPQPVKYT